MKKSSVKHSTYILIVIWGLVVVPAILCLILISKPVEVNNFVGPVELNPYPDGLDWLRRLLIYPGLLLTVAALIIFLRSAADKNSTAADKILNYFILLAVICTGWVCTPYWANGLQFVFNAGTSSMYDPKSLLPYTDIGIAWSIGVMAFFLLAFILILAPVFLAVIDSVKNGFDKKYIYAFGFYLLIFAAFRLTPYFGYWFMD